MTGESEGELRRVEQTIAWRLLAWSKLREAQQLETQAEEFEAEGQRLAREARDAIHAMSDSAFNRGRLSGTAAAYENAGHSLRSRAGALRDRASRVLLSLSESEPESGGAGHVF